MDIAQRVFNCFPVPPHRGDVTVADDDEVRGRRNRLEDAFVVLGKSLTVAQLGGQHRRTPAREELCSLAKEALGGERRPGQASWQSLQSANWHTPWVGWEQWPSRFTGCARNARVQQQLKCHAQGLPLAPQQRTTRQRRSARKLRWSSIGCCYGGGQGKEASPRPSQRAPVPQLQPTRPHLSLDFAVSNSRSRSALSHFSRTPIELKES